MVAEASSPSAAELRSGSPRTASEDSSPGLGDAVAAALGGLSGSSEEQPLPYLPALGEPSGARPAAVVVKGKSSEPEEGRGKKVHVLEASGRSSASDSSLKTSALVNMALAGGRAPGGETSSLEESSRLADAVAAATATTVTAPQEADFAPPEADPPVVSEDHASGQSATGQVSGESTASGVGASHDSAEARAIVAATTVGEQPGVEEKKEQDDSRSLLILLALAAAVLVGYVLWGSSQ
ncbi:MAG TPA: hypothetical protein ENJ18_08140 [Nannocystis exedens]|nr:hypothetical protein [Nannocystis exedens]